jgi:tRNA(Arg) A34 adenosine deaminase TadA
MMEKEYLLEAIRLAVESVTNGGGPFGAVIVKEGRIIARGTNRVTSSNDPTAHAEIVAIREACRAVSDYRLAGCVIYASCEPCPMCLSASYWARVLEIVYAGSQAEAAQGGFDDSFLYRELSLPPEARSLPIRRMLAEKGNEPFEAWKNFAGRAEY